ncbi:hypothetical protein Acf1_00054 [Acidovorax phage ACF1]|nr:hypothetical protein Acf1_00054 [Acidovorax phage ACF1]
MSAPHTPGRLTASEDVKLQVGAGRDSQPPMRDFTFRDNDRDVAAETARSAFAAMPPMPNFTFREDGRDVVAARVHAKLMTDYASLRGRHEELRSACVAMEVAIGSARAERAALAAQLQTLQEACRALLDSELGEIACTGSDAPTEHDLGVIRDLVNGA